MWIFAENSRDGYLEEENAFLSLSPNKDKRPFYKANKYLIYLILCEVNSHTTLPHHKLHK